MSAWLLVTKYRIERCCTERYCRKWKVREVQSGERCYPYQFDSWAQAFDYVQRSQARQWFGHTGLTSCPRAAA